MHTVSRDPSLPVNCPSPTGERLIPPRYRMLALGEGDPHHPRPDGAGQVYPGPIGIEHHGIECGRRHLGLMTKKEARARGEILSSLTVGIRVTLP
jgi:hypothetical protein